LQFGQDWHDGHGRRYELNWVEDTGELYVMQDELPPLWFDPFGDFMTMPIDPATLGVRVIKLVHGRDQVQTLLDGWEEAMAREDGVAWLVDRLRSTPTT
jgi:hypothetical protein